MADLRRDFYLPEEDVQYLDGLGLEWEAIREGSARGVVLYGFLMPKPFQPEKLVDGGQNSHRIGEHPR